jgi:hypothetical protein
MIKAFAISGNHEVYQQNSVRAFVDYLWPIA